MTKKKDTFKNHSALELTKLANDKREELRVLSFSASGSKNRNVKGVHNLRKDIARAMTELNTRKA